MAKRGKITLPPEARRGAAMRTGKGWRLVSPGRRVAFKAALIKNLKIGGEWVAIFRVV